MPRVRPVRCRSVPTGGRDLASAASGRARARRSTRDEADCAPGRQGAALDDLLHLASDLRDRGLADAGRPGVITYSRKVFIPLTRLCRDRCHYCTFVAAPADVPAPFLSPDEVLDIARAGAAARVQGGAVHPGGPARGPVAAGA